MKNAAYYEQERKRIEKELRSIPPMNEKVKSIVTASGFFAWYEQMEDLYSSKKEAYERLEDFHIEVTGHRKYAEYDVFRNVHKKYLKKMAVTGTKYP